MPLWGRLGWETGLQICKGLASPDGNSPQICAPVVGSGSVHPQALPTDTGDDIGTIVLLGFSSLGVGSVEQWVRQVVSDHGKLNPVPGSGFYSVSMQTAFSFFLTVAHDSLAKIYYIPCAVPAWEQGPWKEHQTEDRRCREVSPRSWGSVSSAKRVA